MSGVFEFLHPRSAKFVAEKSRPPHHESSPKTKKNVPLIAGEVSMVSTARLRKKGDSNQLSS